MVKYYDELVRASTWIGQQEKTVFIGQSVFWPGTAVFNTLKDVPMSKRMEFPVAEATQMGHSIGMALGGLVPISIFPRINFLLCAIDPLVNFLDKIERISEGQYKPKVIIRTVVGSEKPLFPGEQHIFDYSDSIRGMLSNVNLIKLEEPEQIFPSYVEAFNSDKSTILVEYGDYYNLK